MQRTPSNHLTPDLQLRMPQETRPRNNFGANGNPGMPIPQAPPAQMFNGHQRNGAVMAGQQPFDVARSPPNPATKSMSHIVHAPQLDVVDWSI